MKISVIICAYNAENTIKKCIDSVKSQTFTDYEIVLINDGSTDSTLEVAQKALSDVKHAQIISQKNMKVSYSRNVGVRAANAPIITFLDADDTLKSNCLERLYTLMQENNADISCSILVNRHHINQVRVLSGAEALADLLSEMHIQGYTCGKLYKKKLFDGISFPEDRVVCEDSAIMYKLVLKSNCVVTTPELLYNYVYINDSLSNRATKKVAEDSFFIRMERYLFYKNIQHIFPDWSALLPIFILNMCHYPALIRFRSEKADEAKQFIKRFYENEKHNLSLKERLKLLFILWVEKTPHFIIVLLYKLKRLFKFILKTR